MKPPYTKDRSYRSEKKAFDDVPVGTAWAPSEKR